MQLIFIHGWAMNHTIWHPAIKALTTGGADYCCKTIDLGFLKSKSTLSNVENISCLTAASELQSDKPTIIIAHSLGVMWALRHLTPLIKVNGFISIAGFSNFTNFTAPDVLAKMQQGLLQNPASQLALFWRRAGCRQLANEFDLSADMNEEALLNGLSNLANWDESQAAAKLNCPALILASKADKIVPEPASLTEWPDQTIHWHETAPHTIQLAEPEWTAHEIVSFISKINA